jgi:hypothetical protein
VIALITCDFGTLASAYQCEARNTRDDPGGEKRGKACERTGGSTLDHFMHMAELKAATRQLPVYLANLERQHAAVRPAARFRPLNSAA